MATSATTPKKPTIIYGLSSEGMGHATRARPVVEALKERYDVHVYCGGRAHAYLSKYFDNVHEHHFIAVVYENNRMNLPKTIVNALLQGPKALWSIASMSWHAFRTKPAAIVSDFEFITVWAAFFSRQPLVSFDNQHLVSHGALPPPETVEDKADKQAVCNAIAWNSPFADRYLISTFYQPGLKPGTDPERYKYVPCAVRPEVLERQGKTRRDGAVLVYQTTTSNDDLPGTLAEASARTGLEFHVYGTGREGAIADGKVRFQEFSEAGFLDDMAAAPFVVVNGGHSTIAEALALGKPVLAEPVIRQYEQKVNVIGLEALGVGRGTEKLSVDDIVQFAREADLMRKRAEQHDVVDNEALFAAMEEAIYDASPKRAALPRCRTPVSPLVTGRRLEATAS